MKVKDKITRFYTIEDLEEILDKLPYQIWLKDDEKKYIYINKLGAEKLGISKEEIIGKTDYEFREYDIAKECDKTDIEVIEKKADIYNEEYSKIDDNEIWHKVYKFILHKENKKEIIGGVAREISLDKNVQLEIESNLMSYLNIHEEKRYNTKKTIHLLLKEIKNIDKSAVTIGKFDGIHKGHTVLIEKAVDLAKKENLKSIVFTFKNNPISYFSNILTREIITEDEKMDKLKSLGVDVVIDIPFNKEMANISAENFVKEILVDKLGVKKLIIGHDFAFAKNREGTPAVLEILGKKYGFTVDIIGAVTINNIRVSSTYVKDLIYAGRVEEIKSYLGRNYFIEGQVIHAKQLGRTIGFPTANLQVKGSKVIPKKGVYYTNVEVNGKIFKGITSIGNNPTVNGIDLTIETYILDFNNDIYDKEINVYFIDRIRDEVKFNNIEELITQLKKDKKYAEERNIAICQNNL